MLGHWNKNIKKQPFGDATALAGEGGGIAKRIKTARLQRKTKPGRDVILHVRPWLWYYIEYQSFDADVKYYAPTMQNRFLEIWCSFLPRNHVIIRGFSPWTASGFYPWGNVECPRERVWSDCVVGGMDTRFQWRKAHSRTAKCEAFHFAPRLFFMFLFLITFTIRQHCIIYPQEFSTEPKIREWRTVSP